MDEARDESSMPVTRKWRIAVVAPSKFMPPSTSVHTSEMLRIENDDKAKSRVE